MAKILLTKSPRHAWLQHPRLNPAYATTDAARFDIGTAAHALLLEGIDSMGIVDADDWRTKAAKEARDEHRAAGRTPILAGQYADIQAMRDVAIKAIAECGDLSGLTLADGKPEQTICWQDEDTHMRARLDWLSDDARIILDYKTTDIASPTAWMRAIASNGYDIQNAFYQRAVRADLEVDAKMVFMVQETSAPFECYFVGLTPSWLEIGKQKVEQAISMWRECMARDLWPGYERRIMWAEPPAWTLVEAEERAIEFQGWSREAFLFGKVADK